NPATAYGIIVIGDLAAENKAGTVYAGLFLHVEAAGKKNQVARDAAGENDLAIEDGDAAINLAGNIGGAVKEGYVAIYRAALFHNQRVIDECDILVLFLAIADDAVVWRKCHRGAGRNEDCQE